MKLIGINSFVNNEASDRVFVTSEAVALTTTIILLDNGQCSATKDAGNNNLKYDNCHLLTGLMRQYLN